MKNISKIIILAALLLAPAAMAQIIGMGTAITNGTTAAPVQVAFVTQTNLAPSNLLQRNLQVQGIDTNETLYLSYAYALPSSGGSNLFVAVTTTNTFPASAGWTNGATWTTTVPANSFLIPVIPYGSITVSNLVRNTTNIVQFY